MTDRILVGLVVLAGLLLAAAIVFGAAAIVLRLAHGRRHRRWMRLEAAWEEALLDVLAGGDTELLRGRVQAADEPYFVEFLLGYARRLRGPETAILQRLAEPYLHHVAPFLSSTSAGRRAHAVATLAVLGLPRAAPQLLAALDDPDPFVFMVAARGLAEYGKTGYAPALLERLHRYARWDPDFTSSMLARLGVETAPAFRAVLADASAPAAAIVIAARALRHLNDLTGADIAAEALDRTTDRDAAAALLRLLRALGRDDHAAAVRRAADRADWTIRAQALAALARVGTAEDRPRLRKALADPSPWVALQAGRALVELGGRADLERAARAGGPGGLVAAELLAEAR